MKNDWSDSKFADWLRGTAKPRSGTAEEWTAWKKRAKQKSFRYWIAEQGLDYLQNIIYSPMTLFNAIRRYISNCWVVKTHALTSNLKRGQWYDLETRLLNSIFDELVNFVETELALQFFQWTAEDRKKYNISWHRKFLRLGFWRCPEAGIDYLNWASQLKYDEEFVNKDHPEIGKPTSQALAAQEISILYRWWKIDRPNRPNSFEASGWRAYSDERNKAAKARGDDPLDYLFSNNTTDEYAREKALFEISGKIEQAQDDEDTDMLIRLIKIRHHLWT